MTVEQNVEQDRGLIRAMASQDSKALGQFYERHNRLVFGLVLRIVGNREDAEEVLLEAFWQAWQQASRYDESRGKPLAWLLTIARSRAIDRLRSGGREHVQVEDIEKYSPASVQNDSDVFADADLRRGVQDALQTLPEQQRTLLEMAYFQGMSHTEIAAAVKQPLGTVKDRIRTGMMHLRKRLKPYL